MNKFICIHGHFYQPPRENPWLEAVSYQDSAYPFHDWNERVNAECYAPNTRARILDEKGFIVEMVNNYSRISFNFGPTLLSWMESHTEETYNAILEADKNSIARFSGHGSAIAQCYSHMIMPLASTRDKYTQIYWGIRDFEKRFNRIPEGMWLPETAVNNATMEIMSDLGIRYTVLAPSQAGRFKIHGQEDWQTEESQALDVSKPYAVSLPSGKSFSVFFYDGPLSQSIAFENLLQNGERFASKLLDAFPDTEDKVRLLSVATDGETYGHHHKFGDMALAYAIQRIEADTNVQLTNYGEFLENFPSEDEVEVLGNTSWSCAHGIGRWQIDCGCSTGGEPDWNQKWRAPLRESLNWLSQKLDSSFDEEARKYLADPWAARNEYTDVINDRSPENVHQFLNNHSVRDLDDSEKITVLKLMEMQRHAMLMHTSCAWFFNDVSGIETEQIFQYARRAIQLNEDVLGDSLEKEYLSYLEPAKSNIPEKGNGKMIYKKIMDKAMMDLPKICAHFALDALFEEFNHESEFYSCLISLKNFQDLKNGKARMVFGCAEMKSGITWESGTYNFCVFHQGDYNLINFVGEFKGGDDFNHNFEIVRKAFDEGKFSDVISHLEQYFGKTMYSLKSLSKNEQKRIFDAILVSTFEENERIYQQLYESNGQLNKYLTEQDIAPPKIFGAIVETVINARLLKEINCQNPDLFLIERLLCEADGQNISLDLEMLSGAFKEGIEHLAHKIVEAPKDLSMLESFENIVKLLVSLSFPINLWKTQNLCYQLMNKVYQEISEKGKDGNATSKQWVKRFNALAATLLIRVPHN